LTDKGIALLPIVVQIGAWGSRWVPASEKLDPKGLAIVRSIQEGGPWLWKRLMADLHATHVASAAATKRRR
jgi:hypothetical protein